MILYIAPYSGLPEEKTPFLAAARKARFLLTALRKIDPEVLLLDSSHSTNTRSISRPLEAFKNHELAITVIRPQQYFHPWVGRSLNIMQADSIIETIFRRFGKPQLCITYNGAAFESRAVASIARHSPLTKIAIEFEDAHFARFRGLHPKPLIDWLAWRRARRSYTHALAVNQQLANITTRLGLRTLLLPGVVGRSIEGIMEMHQPFDRGETVVGYFGGLTEEKGAQILLALIEAFRLRKGVRFVIGGSGPFAEGIRAASLAFPALVTFCGVMTDQDLAKALANTDVLLNPHALNEGVFPFKVMEAIATGRLVVSTRIGEEQLNLAGLCWANAAMVRCDLTVADFVHCIASARSLYEERRAAIRYAAVEAIAQFGEDALPRRLAEIFGITITPSPACCAEHPNN